MNILYKQPNINYSGKSSTSGILPITLVSGNENFYDFNSNPTSSSLSKIYTNAVLEVDNLAKDFYSGTLTEDFYKEAYLNNISVLIRKQRTKNNRTLNNILDFLQRNLNIYKFAYEIYTENKYLKERLIECNEKSSILEDYDKLLKYIVEFSKRLYPIEEQNVTMTTTPTIKNEYKLYIQKYGFPEDGKFDYTKLQEFI